MKGTKMQKGITLIALIITIIVLLILAVVAIAAIQDSDILLHADRSAIMHEVGTISEKIRLESQALKLAGAASSDNAVAQTGENALKSLYAKYDNVEYGTVALKTIKLDKNGTESIPKITDFTKDYHVVMPEKLNYDISRGRDVDITNLRTEDIFVVDDEFNVYYLTTLAEQTVIHPIIGEIPDHLKIYILGPKLEGRDFLEIFDGDFLLDDEVNTPDINERQELELVYELVNMSENPATFGFRYQNELYDFKVNLGNAYTDKDYGVRKIQPKEFDLEKYIFGDDMQGKKGDSLIYDSGLFVDDFYTFDVNESEEIKYIFNLSDDTTTNGGGIYIKYGDILYKFNTSGRREKDSDGYERTVYYTDPSYGLIKVYDYKEQETTRVGKYVDFDGKKWIIIYDDNVNGLQMVCEESLIWNSEGFANESQFNLGMRDSLVEDWNTDELIEKADLDDSKTLDEFERALYSYNNAIKTLNTACDSMVSEHEKVLKVRCVGSNPDPNNIDSENRELYGPEEIKDWADGKAYKVGYSADTNYVSDVDRMIALNIMNQSCWLASREPDKFGNCVEFNIRSIGGNMIRGEYLWQAGTSYVSGNDNYLSNDLRPVVILKPDVQLSDNSGTATDSYTFK